MFRKWKRWRKKKIKGFSLEEIPVSCVAVNPFQPRRDFHIKYIKELSDSIQHFGILQPILVREIKSPAYRYELAAGERRLRASKMAGLKKIPALVGKFTDIEMMQIALLENTHRENLTLLEEAAGYNRLKNEYQKNFALSVEEMGATLPEAMRKLLVLNLPALLRESIHLGILTISQAQQVSQKTHDKKELKDALKNWLASNNKKSHCPYPQNAMPSVILLRNFFQSMKEMGIPLEWADRETHDGTQIYLEIKKPV